MGRAATLGRWILGIGLGLVLLWQMLSLYGGGGVATRYPESAAPRSLNRALLVPPASTEERKGVVDSLTLILRPRRDDLDTVFTADFTIANRGAAAVKDVVIACDALGDDGAAAGHAGTTLRDVFPAHSKRTIRKVALDFLRLDVRSARCFIMDFTVGSWKQARHGTRPQG